MEKLTPYVDTKKYLMIPYNGGYISSQEVADMFGLTRKTVTRYFNNFKGYPKLNSLEEMIEWRESHHRGAFSHRDKDAAAEKRRNTWAAKPKAYKKKKAKKRKPRAENSLFKGDKYWFRGNDYTLAEISKMTGMSISGVMHRVKVWEKKGCIGDVDFEPDPTTLKHGRAFTVDPYEREWEENNTSLQLPDFDDMLCDWRNLRVIYGGEDIFVQLHPQYKGNVKGIIKRMEERIAAIQGESYVYYQKLPRKQPYTQH